MKRPGYRILVLAISALFFGWRSYEAWMEPVTVVASPSPGPVVAPIGVSPAVLPALPMDLSSPVAQIVARPVFRPDRKPYSEDAASASSNRNYDAEISRFTLLGILRMGKEKKGIVVGKGAGARDERWEVGPGDPLPGFIVKEIGVEGVTLSADGREFLLPLYAGGPKSTPGQTPVRTEVTAPRPPVSVPQSPPAGPTGSVSAGGQPLRATPPPAVAPPPAAGGLPPVAPQDPRRFRNVRPKDIPGQR
jgi:hypothetical protein